MGGLLRFEIEADGVLKADGKGDRRTLVEVGRGKIFAQEFQEIPIRRIEKRPVPQHLRMGCS